MTLEELLDHLDTLGVEQINHANSIESECPYCVTLGDGKFLIRKRDGKTVCFKGSCDYGVKKFDAYYALVASIPIAKSREIISGQSFSFKSRELSLNLDAKTNHEEQMEALKPIEWPPESTYPINDFGGEMGAEYLIGRGITKEIAGEYGIRFSIRERRVYFPVMMNGKAYGYQARAIDPVDPGYRMLNNPGFQRSQLVMFIDRLKDSNHAILTEGPVDAIKFHKLGGNICTMGKKISANQIELIKKYNISKIYLALDEDAAPDIRWIQEKVEIPCFLLRVPDSVKKRCAEENKKADFGECTFDECVEAFRNAQEFNRYNTVLYLKD